MEYFTFFRIFVECLIREPVITIAISFAVLLFVKWVFAARPEDDDDEDVVNVKQHKNVQAKALKSPKVDIDVGQHRYAQTTHLELIQLKQNREKLKILDDKISYAKRKIDIMKDNGVIGAIIDDIAGNSIADEQAKIIELEKQKKIYN
jgi:hypothetical protein